MTGIPDWKKYEQIFAGVAMIVVAIGTYALYVFDSDPKTVPDVNALIVAVMAGIAFMRSAPAAVVKQSLKSVEHDVAQTQQDVREVTKAVEESAVADSKGPFSGPLNR